MKNIASKSLKLTTAGFLLTNVFGCTSTGPIPDRNNMAAQHMTELGNTARIDRVARGLQEERQIRVPSHVAAAFPKPIILAPKKAQFCQIDNVTTSRGPEYNVEIISTPDNRIQKTLRELTNVDSSILITGSGVPSSNPNDSFGYVFSVVADRDNKYCIIDTEKMGTRAYHLKEATFNGNRVRSFLNQFDF